MKRRAIVLSLLLACGACVTGQALKTEQEAMKSRLDALREAGVEKCAPVEMATAETHLEFLEVELDQGNSVRASDHRDRAEAALTTALEKGRACKPKDRDGDGIPDDEDQCPDTPGLPEFKGCPDRDGDGIPDHLDKCPDAPEDMDGNEDEDGCPETEDRDGDGVLDKDDECPDTPGPVENKGCPIKDRDGDGILDDVDQCPDEPEDKDGFEDTNGCPDPDNDGDGILDVDDKCPDLPETRNGFQDEDGCPDINPALVVVNRDAGKIEIKQKVYFDTAKATIKSVSFELLNEVAQAIKSSDTMEVIVEGHTDSRGGDAYNLRLSQQRADSVRQYLIDAGVAASKLQAMGFGETRPVDTNNTAAGRERNRRVEFTITKN